MHFRFRCLLLLAITSRFLFPRHLYPQFARIPTNHSCHWAPTASSQFCCLNTIPFPYFLSHRQLLSKPCNPPLAAILLFLSGDIQLNPGPTNTPIKICTINIRSLFHETRSIFIDDLIHTNNPDVFAFSETWHSIDTTTPAQLSEVTPSGFQLFSLPRSSSGLTRHTAAPTKEVSGGGLAFLCKDSLSPEIFSLPVYKSFEVFSVSLTRLSRRLTIFNVYRPPDSSHYSQPFSSFLTDFASFLTIASTIPHNFLITGDFNIHCNNISHPQVAQFQSILSDFNLQQHVNFPTHKDGNTLDLLITPVNSPLTPTVTSLPSTPSDHFALLSVISTQSPPLHPVVQHSFRRINAINIDDFISDLSTSELLLDPPSELDELVDCYNSTLINILNGHAPLITKPIRSSKSNPWYTPALHALKKTRRTLERQCRSLPTLANLAALRKASNHYHHAILAAKKLYHSNLISSNSSNPRQLWKTVNNLLHRSPAPAFPNISSVTSVAQQFSTFFSDKVTKLRANITPVIQSPYFPQPARNPPSLDCFRPTDLAEITKLILSSPNKQCELDPIPTAILKQCVSTLAPTITNIVNLSLSSGTFPSSFKKSLVSPLLKKPNLDKNSFSNYRPISNLSFLSKLTERVVKNRLTDHLGKHSLFNIFQSAYTAFHSTESVLLSLHDFIVRSICRQQVTCLCLLDLSAAFDTIDHSILLDRLSTWFGVNNSALSWFRSYLSNRTFAVSSCSHRSTLTPLCCGVPQGSVLGPLLFSLYTTPLSSLISGTSVSHHLYADDTQLFISFLPQQFSSSVTQLQSAISLVSTWMSANLLSLNPSKTEFLIFGNSSQLSKLANPSLQINSDTTISPVSSARNLGILFDSCLSFDDHISSLCKTCNWHIRDLRRIRSTLNLSTAKTIATSLVHSKLDYCNSLYLNLPAYQISRLQHIQNSLARAVCKVPKRQHITPYLKSLHWLKIQQRIQYKTLSITYSLLQHNQPSYLRPLISVKPPGPTRSSSLVTLCRPTPTRLQFSNRSFYHTVPKLWESLPADMRTPASSSTTNPNNPLPVVNITRNQFLSRLKTHLFRRSYPP